MNTFSSLCIGACVFMIFLGFSFAFVDAIGGLPTSRTSPFDPTDSSLDIVQNLSSNITGGGTLSFGSMWLTAIGVTTIGVFAFAILTQSTNLIGIYLFGTFFWSSWASLVGILYTFDVLTTGAGLILLTMITVGMTIMFVGAIIGMLSGSASMR